MSFNSLSEISGLIIVICMLLMGYSLERIAAKKHKYICILVASTICSFISIKIFSSIDDDLYISSNNSYSIKLIDMYYDDSILMTKDRYNISIDGYDSDIKIWAYNTKKAKEVFNKNNNSDHFFDYLQVSSKQNKITPSVLMSLLFTKCNLESFVIQDINLKPNTGVVNVTGDLKSVTKDEKTYYLIDEYILCGQDVDSRISAISDKGKVTLNISYDIEKANGKEFFKYKIS